MEIDTDIERRVSDRRRHIRRPFLVALLILLNLALAVGGGVAGFVLLSNSNLPVVTHLRTKLGLDASSSVSIPVTQNLKLEESSGVIDASKKISPAVVSISINQSVVDYFGQKTTQETGAGSGFILTSDGLIVTNKHVVEDATAQYKVVLDDGRIFDAKIQARDTLNDLAFVKIEAKDLPTVELGSSSDLQVGQYVLTVGNALGEFKNSVSLGIISAKNRSITASDSSSTSSESLSGLLQTDASLNPGNSGGPLVNLKGQVVGINTAIASASGTSQGSIGIGFAIPIDSIRSVIDSVRKTGAIVRPYLGVRYVPVTTSLQQVDKLSVNYGALVTKGVNASETAVIAGGPADKAGVKEGDIILMVNGERVDDGNALTSRLSGYAVGDTVTLHILRGTTEQDVKVTLGQAPAAQ